VKKTTIFLTLSLVFFSLIPIGFSENVVNNYGFETGDLSNWTVIGYGTATVTSEKSYSGSYSLWMGNDLVYISQNISRNISYVEFYYYKNQTDTNFVGIPTIFLRNQTGDICKITYNGTLNTWKRVYFNLETGENESITTSDCPIGSEIYVHEIRIGFDGYNQTEGGFFDNIMAYSREITKCDDVLLEGRHTLISDVSGSDSVCINIPVSNVILDCNTYTITGNGSNTGIRIGAAPTNITVEDCHLRNFYKGVLFFNDREIEVLSNVTIKNSDIRANYTIYSNAQITSGYVFNNTLNGSIFVNTTPAYHDITFERNYYTNPDGTGYSDTCTDSDCDKICDTPYSVYDSVTDDYTLSFYTYPSGFIVTFNYSSINFGSVNPYQTYEVDGVFACGYSNSSFEVYVNGTNFSTEWTIDNLNLTMYYTGYSKTKTLSTSRTLFDTFVQGLFKHFHKFLVYVPLVSPGTYTATVTIDYLLV